MAVAFDQVALEKEVIKQAEIAKRKAQSAVSKGLEEYSRVKGEKPPDPIEFFSFCQERRINVTYKECDDYLNHGTEKKEEKEEFEQIIVEPLEKPLSKVEKAFNTYLQAKTYVIKGEKFEPPMDAIEFVSFCQERCIAVTYEECDKFLMARKNNQKEEKKEDEDTVDEDTVNVD